MIYWQVPTVFEFISLSLVFREILHHFSWHHCFSLLCFAGGYLCKTLQRTHLKKPFFKLILYMNIPDIYLFIYFSQKHRIITKLHEDEQMWEKKTNVLDWLLCVYNSSQISFVSTGKLPNYNQFVSENKAVVKLFGPCVETATWSSFVPGGLAHSRE